MQLLGDDDKITGSFLDGSRHVTKQLTILDCRFEDYARVCMTTSAFVLLRGHVLHCMFLFRPGLNDAEFAALSGVTGKAEIMVSSYWRLVKHDSTVRFSSYP